MSDIWAIIPVKEFDGAKHRLSGLLSPPQRRLLAENMLTDVIEAVTGCQLLAGVLIVTLDPHATTLGKKIGARIVTEGARDGHTGSVNAGRRVLAGEGRRGIITMPGDIPATRADEIDAVLSAHLAAPSFTISPAHGPTDAHRCLPFSVMDCSSLDVSASALPRAAAPVR